MQGGSHERRPAACSNQRAWPWPARLSLRTPAAAAAAAILTTKSSQPTWADGAAPSSPEGSDLRGQGG